MKKKIKKMRVLGFLEIRGILRFLKNNKDNFIFA